MTSPALARWLDGVWYRQRSVPAWLAVLESAYRAGLQVRRLAFRRRWFQQTRLPLPVVVVGNVTVGGTGKTPLVIWLVRELQQRGWSPGVLLRGYGGSASHAQAVAPDADADSVGDEALLVRRATGAPVAIGRRRAQAGAILVERGDCDVLLTDDGLQHWALARDLEIAVIDGERRLGNGRLLPAGPLREPAERLQHVDFIVCNGAPREGEIAMRVQGVQAWALADQGRSLPLSAFRGQKVHAVAGLGNPQRFFDMLTAEGLAVIPHPLDDHHRFSGNELRFDDDLAVLTTEKDAVKCADLTLPGVWVVPAEAHLPQSFADAVHRRLCALRSRSGACA